MYKRKDAYYARAKAAGYRSRAAYKLLELARRYRMIRTGDHVVDLGAWPGGWLQVAAELTGPKGLVVGVDLVPVEVPPGGTVAFVCGDARVPAIQEEIMRRIGGRVDVVLSDMAPKLTGIRATDEARGAELADTALRAAGRMLRPQGRLVMKVFMNPETERIVDAVRREFAEVRLTRPEASRSGSAELYVVALGFRGPSDSSPADPEPPSSGGRCSILAK